MTCTFGMPLESTHAGWCVTVGFDVALAMLFISATRFKMLDKSVPVHHRSCRPENHGQIKGLFDGRFSRSGHHAWRHVHLVTLGDVGSSELSAHQMAPPSRARRWSLFFFSVSLFTPLWRFGTFGPQLIFAGRWFVVVR